jgi:hypothetical protein
MCSVDTFELSPRAIRLIGSRLNGVLFGYVGRVGSSGTVTSMSFMDGASGRMIARVRSPVPG